MSDVLENNILKWVKGELDASIDSARHDLERYMEGGDSDSIDSCVNTLHKIHGTLKMVELFGAAMLSEEMELVARALQSKPDHKREETAEALMLGLVKLSAYLEKIESGARDLPLFLLPTLNELRAVQDAPLLSEVALFAPELERRLASGVVQGSANPALSGQARRLRHSYHKALLDLYRDRDAVGGLKRTSEILKLLESAAGTEQVKRLFTVGKALASAMAGEAVATGIATKLLLGRIDNEIKRVIDHGEQAAAEDPANDLLKNLLYYIACIEESDDLLVNRIQSDFDLKNSFVSQAELDRERGQLEGPGRELLESLRSAIKADLTTIKDGLDLYIRSDEGDVDRLISLAPAMHKLADTLGMVGQGGLRQRLKQQADKIDGFNETSSQPSGQDLMAMAEDILFIEVSLDNLSTSISRQFERDDAVTDGIMPDGEYDRSILAVMHEASVDLARNKEAFIKYVESPEKSELIADVPRRFSQIAGAFRILSISDAAGLLDSLAGYVDDRLLEEGVEPSQGDLEAFADAVTSVEYFMQGVTEGRGVQSEILEVARDSISKLAPEAGESWIDDLPDAITDTFEYEEISIDDDLGEPDEVTIPATSEDSDQQAAVDVPEENIFEGIDSEILDIFLEEAKEELALVQEYLPRWLDDRDDSSALTTFRRSFHTLKGSGRLVGATQIGEFSWSIENLLNRIIDETVEVTPKVTELLSDAMEILPVLVDAQETGVAPSVDTQPVMDRAFALADPSRAGDEETAEEDLQVDGADGADNQPAISMDETLFEIFREESAVHIASARGFLESCRLSASDCKQDSELMRALHTLHGSADMAEVEPIAQISTALEGLVERERPLNNRDSAYVLDLIARGCDLFEAVLDIINAPGLAIPEWGGLAEDINGYTGAADLQLPVAGNDALFEPEYDTATELEIEGLLDAEEESETAAELEIETEFEAVEALEAEAEPEAESEADAEPRLEAVLNTEADEYVVTDVDDAMPLESELPDGMVLLDVDGEMLEIFLEEGGELLEELEVELQQWRQTPSSSEALSGMQRTLHTLKGGARLVGATPVGDLSHSLETLLEPLLNGERPAGEDDFALAQQVADHLAEQIDDLSKGPMVRNADELISQLENDGSSRQGGFSEPVEPVLESTDEVEADEATSPDIVKPETADESPGSLPESEVVAATAANRQRLEKAQASGPAARVGREQMRVQAALLDRLVNNAGEVSIYRSRLDEQNNSLGFNLTELEQTVERLRNQLRQLEMETEAQILFRYESDQDGTSGEGQDFDPLEFDRFSTMQQVSRSLLETVSDLSNINEYLFDLQNETETLLLQQSRLTSDLQDGLMRTRMVPFSQIMPRLQRLVRQTSGQMGKKAELVAKGVEGEVDRAIRERMLAPLEHILRNAVSHGIELPKKRLKKGKSEAGLISLELSREGNDVLISVSDDGVGLRTNAIRHKAIESGLLNVDADVQDSDVMQFVLEHGFSTADEVTQIAGRGVGLDVVVSEIKQMGGTLELESKEGEGTSFHIRLPLTLAISDALLVELSDEVYAIPHTNIEGVVRLPTAELQALYDSGGDGYSYAGQEYSVRYLGSLTHERPPSLGDQRKWYPLLLVKAGEHRVALQVDNLLGNRQIVVKPVGPQIGSVLWISGGTILGDGRVALILDITALVRAGLAHAAITITDKTEEAPTPEPGKLDLGIGRTIMVVDDSITVRKVTGRLLERNQMHVMTAKDGVDALAQLQEQLPDVMLLDIEMPRMDGFELARHMRNSDDLKHIPIIMITSRTGEKHRNHAMELGARRYLGKPYQESDLMENIRSVLAGEV